YGRRVDVADNADVIVVGSTETTSNGLDALVVRYDLSGAFLWERLFDGTAHGSDSADAVAVDGSGNVFVAGRTTTIGQGANVWVTKLAPDGSTVWTHEYDGPASQNDRAH